MTNDKKSTAILPVDGAAPRRVRVVTGIRAGAAAQTNPLYSGSAKAGNNPLYKA